MSSTLHDFTDVEPLVVREIQPLRYPDNPEKFVGFLGPSNRDANCIVCQRKRHPYWEDGEQKQHFYRKGGGYSFSESTLGLLRRASVSRIVIEETDNDRLLEFNLVDYESGQFSNEMGDDPQRFVPVDEALHEWTASEATIIRDHQL
jgi:hypothetical protein